MKTKKLLTIAVIISMLSFIAVSVVLAVSADRDNFVILGKSAEDSEGKSILLDEKIILRIAPDINSQEQGRVDPGSSVRVLDKKVVESGTFYLVLKIGEGGGLSGWVSEEDIYEVTVEPQEE